MGDGVERGSVLTQTLSLIESEQRKGPGRTFDNRSTDNGPVLVIDKIDKTDYIAYRQFAFVLRLFQTHSGHLLQRTSQGPARTYWIPGCSLARSRVDRWSPRGRRRSCMSQVGYRGKSRRCEDFRRSERRSWAN